MTPAIAIGSGGAAETVLVSGNADLWTANAGYNQDIGIFVSEDGGTADAGGLEGVGGLRGHLLAQRGLRAGGCTRWSRDTIHLLPGVEDQHAGDRGDHLRRAPARSAPPSHPPASPWSPESDREARGLEGVGGFAGIFSPTAAYVQAVYTIEPGSATSFYLEWKTNKPAWGATIYAGAGPIGAAFSPTRLTVVPQMLS